MIFGVYYTDFFLYFRMGVLAVLAVAVAYWIYRNRVRVTTTKLRVHTPDVSKEEQARILTRYEKRMAPLPTALETRQLGAVDLSTDEVDAAFEGEFASEDDQEDDALEEDDATEDTVAALLRLRLSEARTYAAPRADEELPDEELEFTVDDQEHPEQAVPSTPKPPVDHWKKRLLDAPVKLNVRCLDLHHCDILVDNRRLLELRGEREKACLVPAGEILLELAQPGELTGYVGARIDTGSALEIQVGVADGEAISFYNHKGKWTVLGQSKLSAAAVVVGDDDTVDEPWAEPARARPPRPSRGDRERGPAAVPLTDGLPAFPDFDDLDERSRAVATVRLTVISSDGEWADVLADGEPVAALKADKMVQAEVPEGRPLIEVRAFMELRAYAAAVVDTQGCSHVTIHLTEGKPFTVEGARNVTFQST